MARVAAGNRRGRPEWHSSGSSNGTGSGRTSSAPSAERVKAEVKEKDLRQIRISWGDQHGILRGKTLTVTEFLSSLEDGKDFQFVTSIFDTTNHPIVPPFGAGNFAGAPELTGLPDGVLVPDPTTFRLLPWVEKTGWILSDAYFQNGREHPFSTRGVLRRQLEDLATLGYDFTAGLEIEFYVFRMLDPNLRPEQCGYPPEPPTVNGLAHGFQYLTENRNDEIHDLLWELQDNTERLGLPLLTIEDEWGAGQIEFTFAPENGMQAADHALLFRSAIKQVCRRLGYHATFMARPAFPDYFASGWHVHQSLSPVASGGNAFTDETGGQRLTDLGHAVDRQACSSTRCRRRCSRRRPSTATSATGPTRSRPTAWCGRSRTAARCCA